MYMYITQIIQQLNALHKLVVILSDVFLYLYPNVVAGLWNGGWVYACIEVMNVEVYSISLWCNNLI